MRLATLVTIAVTCLGITTSLRAEIFTEDFSSLYLSTGRGQNPADGLEEIDCGGGDPPLPNCSVQANTGLEVFAWGWVPGWQPTGFHTAHAVDLGDNVALMLFSGTIGAVVVDNNSNNQIISDPISANAFGTTYNVSFDAGPAVFDRISEATTDTSGILLEVLRADDSVLADLTYSPGAWPGGPDAQELERADILTYEGDGSGNVRLRLISDPGNSNQFGGTVDNLRIESGGADVFFEDFNEFQGDSRCDGTQSETGLTVSCNKSLDGWSKSGLAALHNVDLDGTGDTAVMLFNGKPIVQGRSNTNTLTLVEGIDANLAGGKYNLTAKIGPSVWNTPDQATAEDDFILIQLLREDDSVLASFEAHPDHWEEGSPDAQDFEGDGMLDSPVEFGYTGDGSGPVRISLLAEVQGSGRFSGAIDDIVVSLLSLSGPSTGIAEDINENGIVDFADFVFLSNDFGNSGDAIRNRFTDIDGDGTVAFSDFVRLSNAWGTTAPSVTSVPEPAGLRQLSLGLLVLVSRRRKTLAFTL